MANRAFIHQPLYGLAASALFLGLLTDLAYSATTDFIWVDMSDWLVSIGAVVGFLALIVGIVEIVSAPRWRRPGWVFGLASLLAWAAAVLNMLVHSRDSLTSVVPLGLTLSAVTCALLFVAWWASISVSTQRFSEVPA